MRKNFLVTGGCGFIGSHLVDALIAEGHGVRILDDLSSGTLQYKPVEAELVMGTVTDPGVVEAAMGGMDGCFHLAAIASVVRCNDQWADSHRVNLTGTINVFNAARGGPLPVVYASSAAVYGNNPDVVAETEQAHPLSAYGADKYGCEMHGVAAKHVHRVPNVGLRFFNVYGPRQDPTSPYSGVISIFGSRLQAGRSLTINGDGYNSRDFIYVGDVVRALIMAMDHCSSSDDADVFNICTGIETNIVDLADEMATVLRKNTKIDFGPKRPGDIRRSVGCPEKAAEVLGFKTQTSLHEGLMQTLNQHVYA